MALLTEKKSWLQFNSIDKRELHIFELGFTKPQLNVSAHRQLIWISYVLLVHLHNNTCVIIFKWWKGQALLIWGLYENAKKLVIYITLPKIAWKVKKTGFFYFAEGNHLFLIMEYCAGGTLWERMREDFSEITVSENK